MNVNGVIPFFLIIVIGVIAASASLTLSGKFSSPAFITPVSPGQQPITSFIDSFSSEKYIQSKTNVQVSGGFAIPTGPGGTGSFISVLIPTYIPISYLLPTWQETAAGVSLEVSPDGTQWLPAQNGQPVSNYPADKDFQYRVTFSSNTKLDWIKFQWSTAITSFTDDYIQDIQTNPTIDQASIQTTSWDGISSYYPTGTGGEIPGNSPGLAALYHANDDLADGKATDSSPNSNHALCSGSSCPAVASGKYSNAYQFDGTDDHLDAPDSPSLDIQNQLTLASWVNFQSTSTWQHVISKVVQNGSHSSPYFAYSIHAQPVSGGYKPRFWVTTGGSGKYVQSNALIPLGSWHHVTGTYDGSQIKIYIDGILDNSATATGQINNYAGPLKIGANGAQGELFKGIMDEAAIWDRALQDSEIAALAQGGPSGSFQSRFISTGQPVYSLTPSWQDTGNKVSLELSPDGTTWYPAQNGNPIGGFPFPDTNFKYRVTFTGQTSMDKISIAWSFTSPPICGDGKKEGSEECDDGNTNNCDACTNQCKIYAPACGNSCPDSGEQCDDGNLNSCDGCDSLCRSESCGNNRRECSEECDGTDNSACTSGVCLSDCTCQGGGGDICGDNVCGQTESCSTCPQDCGSCGGGVSFEKVQIESGSTNPAQPHSKTIGDIDGDSFLDAIVSSRSGDGMFWYKYPSWTKIRIATGSFSTDMQAGDIDNDGDLDIVAPGADYQLRWYQNPSPASDPQTNITWTAVSVGAKLSNYHHDVDVGDLNKDGRLDIVTRRKVTDANGLAMVYYQNSPVGSWTEVAVSSRYGEGLALGDVDNDGDLDIALNGYWLENPYPSTSPWNEFRVKNSPWSSFEVGVHVMDINKDGRNDVILGPSESSNGMLAWYETANPKSNTDWTEHIVDNSVSYLHTFKTADFDIDGDIDLATAEMHQSSNREVNVYLNNGNALTWTTVPVSTEGSHNIRLGDFENDGDIDIFGVNWHDNAGDSAEVKYWRNKLNPKLSLDSWQRRVIESSKPWKSVFIAAADLDADMKKDIITGGWWYKNPGNLDNSWTRNTIGSPLHNMNSIYDFDSDGDSDILGTQWQGSGSSPNFAWARNNGAGSFTVFTNLQTADGDFLQGEAVQQFAPGSFHQVALSWHTGGKGVQMFTVPQNPSVDTWVWSKISTNSQDEQLSSGDIDRDGDGDIVQGTKWLRNDRTGWTQFALSSDAANPDRNRLADVNRDGRQDVVVGYQGVSVAAKLAWYEQGSSATALWTEHIIATDVIGPMSVDVKDMDNDGDVDVVVGEHNLNNPASAKLFIFENTDKIGNTWVRHTISTGDEHHDGTQVVDIDGDGDKDIISIGWGHSNVLLYENKAI